jgi:hypothetical protein
VRIHPPGRRLEQIARERHTHRGSDRGEREASGNLLTERVQIILDDDTKLAEVEAAVARTEASLARIRGRVTL